MEEFEKLLSESFQSDLLPGESPQAEGEAAEASSVPQPADDAFDNRSTEELSDGIDLGPSDQPDDQAGPNQHSGHNDQDERVAAPASAEHE